MRKTIFILVLIIFTFSLQSAAQTCSPASTGLVSWWSGDNNALDSRSRSNGTLQNGATFASGKVGQGLSFDGVDDQITIPHIANQNVGSNLTIEAWINPTTLPHGETIIQKRSSSNIGGFLFEPTQNPFGSPNGLQFVIMIGGVYQTLNPANVLTAGVWQHVAATYDGAFMRIYVNGIEVGNKAQTGAIDSVTDPIIIGRNAVNNTPFSGGIDEVGLYNRALSATEIQSIVVAGTAGKCKPTATVSPSGQVGFWSGDGNLNDISGNNNNGTIQSGTTFTSGKVGQSLQFDGNAPSLVSIPDSASLRPSTGVTVEAWINPSPAASGFQGVLFKGNTGSAGGQPYSLFVSGPTHSIVIRVGNDSTFQAFNSNSGIPTNTYSHVAFTYDGSTVRIYINGVLDSSATSTIGTLAQTDTNPLLLGGLGTPFNFTGNADEIAVYNRALAIDEIQSIYNAGIAGKLKDNTTPTGSNVAVNTKSDATVTFPTVTTAGITQQIPIDLASFPNLPNGFTATGLAYDLATSATYSGSPNVCFNVPSVTTSNAFNNLRILHFESNTWTNRTGTIDFNTKTICSSGLTSLSPFVVANSAPTAANASINGRVINANGRGISNVNLQLTNLATNEVLNVRSNNFGKYSFPDLEAGQTYILSVTAKRFSFTNPSRIITLSADLTDEDFVAN